MKKISSFQGKYRFLSNFYISPFTDSKNLTWDSVEHYYQAMKSKNPMVRRSIRLAATPAEAKKKGRKIYIRDDWDKIKDRVMLMGLYHKFDQNFELAQRLINLKDYILEEGNTWGDTYWGVYNGRGENKLGKSLMIVRDYFIQEINNG